MSRIFIDTDVLIHFLRGHDEVGAAIRTIADKHHACCSVVTVGELIAGMRPAEKTSTYELLDGFEIYDVDFATAELAGTFKRQTKSHQLSLDDCLIAAAAHLHGDFLYTFNRKHYPMKEIKFWDIED